MRLCRCFVVCVCVKGYEVTSCVHNTRKLLVFLLVFLLCFCCCCCGGVDSLLSWLCSYRLGGGVEDCYGHLTHRRDDGQSERHCEGTGKIKGVNEKRIPHSRRHAHQRGGGTNDLVAFEQSIVTVLVKCDKIKWCRVKSRKK